MSMLHAPSNAGPSLPSAERRQLTVVFCDLVGSTAMAERLDPEDLRDLLRDYRQICAKVVEEYNGFVARYIGDGILIYFGYPQAHEHDPEHALRASLKIVSSLEDWGGSEMRIRIGVATGMVVAGDIVGEGTEERHAVVGSTPNLAARLIELARPNEVVVADVTQELLKDLFNFHDLGEMSLKGFDQPVRAWRTLGESEIRSHSHAVYNRLYTTPLISRDDEIARLERCWEKSRSGDGQVVLLSGEAGIGKSRLLRHFEQTILENSELCSIKKFYCAHNHKTSYLYPFVDHIVRRAKIAECRTDDEKIVALKACMNWQDDISSESVYLLLDLISPSQEISLKLQHLDPNSRKAKTFRLLEDYVCDCSKPYPAMVIVEDLHWSDSATEEFLTQIVQDRCCQLPILVALTYRDSFSSDWPNEHFFTNMKLRRLSPRASAQLLNELAPDLDLPPRTVEQIIDRSDRIPLFLEEVLKATRYRISSEDRAGRVHASANLASVGVPASLAGSLMERLDRLGSVKTVAQMAASIGHVFSVETLEGISSDGTPELQNALETLAESEIICRLEVGGRNDYAFRHALLRDAAYSSILRGDRRRLHRRIGEFYEAKEAVGGTVEAEAELIGYHFTEGDLPLKAVNYLFRAGERARQISANSEAIEHLSKGIALLEKLPDSRHRAETEIELRTSLALAYTAVRGGGAAEVKENYDRARQLNNVYQTKVNQFTVMLGCWINSFVSGDMNLADALSGELLDIAEREGISSHLVEANRVRGMTLFYRGDFNGARLVLESARQLHNPDHHAVHAFRFGLDPLVCINAYLSFVLLFLGQSREARQKSTLAIDMASRLDHPYTQVFSVAFAALVRQNLGLVREARELSAKAFQLADEHDFQFWTRQQSIITIWADYESCQKNVPVSAIRTAVESFSSAGSSVGSTRYLSLLAETYINDRQIGEGADFLERARQTVEQTGERFYLAEIHRLQGELCGVRSGMWLVPEVCQHFLHSLDVSEEQGAMHWVRRTAESIAQLCWTNGRELDKARHLANMCSEHEEQMEINCTIRACRELLQGLVAS